MGSNSKLFKACIEDRISGLPDAIFFHIISFLETRDAVKTCLLSHTWNNVWTYVPNLEVYVSSPKYDSDEHVPQPGFVDRVLLFRNLSNIHKFSLICLGIEDYFDRIDAWVCTAIRRNVVELNLDLYTTPSNSYEGCLKLPTSIFICKTLVVLKLILTDQVIAIPPNSSCFPSLKYLDVQDDPYATDGGYEYKNFVNANAPNLEKFNVEYLLASYSLKNVKSLSTVELKFKGLHAGENLYFADRIHKLFAEIVNVKYLSILASIVGNINCRAHGAHIDDPDKYDYDSDNSDNYDEDDLHDHMKSVSLLKLTCEFAALY
ncbi:F-box/LRR-repeat protein At3g59200 [Rosa chinensis]|uniref:F-box/LRR-repeat protein At3g59200 n=1 Tax=Rosa chinensis TaxID=74649 RepID=UPI001AD8E144|nr:F-box/LRR-repeat protein At3g59200 [Rosa chinensis]